MADILIVDDDPQVSRLMQRILEEAGHECRQTAKDVPTAKEILRHSIFDLVVSDINMPGESGVDLIRHIKQYYPDTGAVVASVIDNPDEAREVLDLGVYGYITKPFTRNLALICIENALKRHRLEIQERYHVQFLETEVKKKTTDLKERLSFMDALMEAIPIPIYYKTTEGLYKGCNAAFELFIGLKKGDIVGKTVHSIAIEEESDTYSKKDNILFQNGERQVYEGLITHMDGSRRNVVFNKAPYYDTNDNVAGLVCAIMDITARKKAEASLRMSEEKYRTIMENIGIGVCLLTPQMEILELNKKMEHWYPGASMKEKPVCYQEVSDPPRNSPCDDCPAVPALETGRQHEMIIAKASPRGTRQFRRVASVIHDANGKVTGAIQMVEDVTEKLTQEHEFRQNQKLEAIGQLAAGIAHEINSPIQYVSNNVSFLKEAFEDLMGLIDGIDKLSANAVKSGATGIEPKAIADISAEADLPYLLEEIPLALDQALEGVHRVSKIVRAMREFSHPGTDKMVAMDLNQALESTITVSRNEWKYVADLETEFGADVPVIECLPGEVNQVFLNIIVNAAHAIEDATGVGKERKGRILITTQAISGAVEVRIADNGGGIPESVQDRIFDPFFTTKEVGRGTGQGLSIARNVIVEKHGGALEFETERGVGTTFIIRLPIANSDLKESN